MGAINPLMIYYGEGILPSQILKNRIFLFVSAPGFHYL